MKLRFEKDCVQMKLTLGLLLLLPEAVRSLQNYLDLLSSHPSSSRASYSGYLDTLQQPSEESMVHSKAFEEPPDDHYSKDHFGAGWGGYKHPMYGGYLDHLSDGQERVAEESPVGVLPAGKKADYGDDIRWGAQVYLDNLK